MPSERHFLGWDQPVLPAAAAWLGGRYGHDLGGVIVAVPAARAGRRLIELLAEQAAGLSGDSGGDSDGNSGGGGALIPPRVVTVGQLPELLYEPPAEPADEWSAALARTAALRSADAEVLAAVAPHPPDADDVVGWWRLAESLGRLSDELAAARLTPGHVVELAAQRGVDLGLGEARWRALAALEERYRVTLGADDRQMARQRAITSNACRCDGDVVLVGLVDLSDQLAGMLEQIENVTALVPAPDEHAAGFDARGGLVVDSWVHQPIAVDDLRVVDRPRDQAAEVVRVLGELPAGTSADQVTVGLGDEEAAGPLRRAVEQTGTPARVAAGRPLPRSAPVLLLELIARYAAARRFADLAALARHPDAADVIGDDEPWLTRLDEYATTTLQADLRGRWRGDEEMRETMSRLGDRIDALLPDAASPRRPLPDWAEPIAAVLREVYRRRTLNRGADHALVEALQQIGGALGQLAALDATRDTTPTVSFDEAVSFVVGRLASGHVPEPAGGPAVELLGFLELPWDDADFAVLTDVNEGHVPDARQADAWLPDGLRSALNLPDNARRYARDVLLLNIVLRSKRRVTVLTVRRSAEGDPLTPSRLLLACDDATRVARVKSFYAEPEESDSTLPAAPTLWVPGGRNLFLIPRPVLDDPPLDKLTVTAFRDYLACPYRFYLKHVRRLGAIDDRAAELDALAYGNLAHDVLEDFGRSEIADATDAAVIEALLDERLDARAAGRYGRHPRAAVRVQVEQLRRRLARFADVQAAEARDGWRIRGDLIERRREVAVEVDGESFTIVGRIDRIDQHPERGYRVLDYKTSDAGRSPEQTHRKQGDWVDLQLPLYLTLTEALGLGTPTLGYFNLPKAEADTGVASARWDAAELGEAFAARDAVIRGVRGRVFWPPSLDPPSYTDAFTRIAADRALERPGLIGGGA